MPSKRLNSIVVIDDDQADQYLHRRALLRANVTDTIVGCRWAMDALDYLGRPLPDNGFPHPEMILLDLNMPAMSGWDFLDEYAHLPDPAFHDAKVVIVSTSSNPDDLARARAHPGVAGYRVKPLNDVGVLSIVDEIFPAA